MFHILNLLIRRRKRVSKIHQAVAKVLQILLPLPVFCEQMPEFFAQSSCARNLETEEKFGIPGIYPTADRGGSLIHKQKILDVCKCLQACFLKNLEIIRFYNSALANFEGFCRLFSFGLQSEDFLRSMDPFTA